MSLLDVKIRRKHSRRLLIAGGRSGRSGGLSPYLTREIKFYLFGADYVHHVLKVHPRLHKND